MTNSRIIVGSYALLCGLLASTFFASGVGVLGSWNRVEASIGKAWAMSAQDDDDDGEYLDDDDLDGEKIFRVLARVVKAPKVNKKKRGQSTKPEKIEKIIPVIVKARSGKYELTGLKGASWYQHRSAKLKDIGNGSSVFVLARRQEAVRGAPGQSLDPQIVSIQCIISGSFSPPELTKKQESARLQWMMGSLAVLNNNTKFTLNGTNMQAGSSREVLMIKRVKGGSIPIRKGLTIRIASQVSDKKWTSLSKRDRKVRKLKVSRVDFIDSKYKGLKYLFKQ